MQLNELKAILLLYVQLFTGPHLIKEMAQGRNHMIKLSEDPFKISVFIFSTYTENHLLFIL